LYKVNKEQKDMCSSPLTPPVNHVVNWSVFGGCNMLVQHSCRLRLCRP